MRNLMLVLMITMGLTQWGVRVHRGSGGRGWGDRSRVRI
jgi:hypothetical protein